MHLHFISYASNKKWKYTVKEHDHHWDSQQDSNQIEISINFNVIKILVLIHTRQHMYVIYMMHFL
jgi:hypothetical protein